MKNCHVRRGIPWMVMSFFLAVTGCGGDSGTNGGNGGGGGGGGGTTPVAAIAVNVDDDFFTPPDILVVPGATVTWTWIGGIDHNVTFASATVSAPSADQTTGTFQVAMPTAVGVYSYQCTIHGSSMSGSVTVQ